MKIKSTLIALFVFGSVLSFASLAHAQVFTENLYYGLQSNSQVSQLQEFLTSEGLYHGPITGNFFFLTLSAVKTFQVQQHITPAAGYFGSVTMAAANKIADAAVNASNAQAISETGTSTPPVQVSSTSELQLEALLQEVALLEQQLQTQQSSTQEIQTLQSQVQQQAQTLQQIASSTASIASTTKPVVPTATILANGSSGLITIPYNTGASITWTSSNANSCDVLPFNAMTTSGTESTGNLTTSQTYVISCSGSGGSTSASVTVYVAPPITATTTPTSTSVTYTITASAGTGGTITPSGTVSVVIGSSETFAIAANQGYEISNKVIDGNSVANTANSYTFTNVRANHTIEALFISGNNATLKNLTMSNGSLSPSFNQNIYAYTVTLPAGTTMVPTVSYQTTDPQATATVTQATSLSGTATVLVTAENGTTQQSYTVNFAVQPSYSVSATSANSNSPESTSQCNFNGDVFNCTSNPNITVSLAAPLTNTPSSISYVQPITINDPNTSSQNFRWNIIGNYLPPGIGFAFSPSQALECSGTNCFFTSPPSGLSYPANSPGEFFGTPTAAGTYSFTLQGIDDANYFTLPWFSLTVVQTSTTQ